ncbi:MAG: hypothetical protein DMF70_14895 [Acidobacteria bacterium]|nr:MAG: hypothetical protein DMF70_14895 [Acidobacteriota bacterium]
MNAQERQELIARYQDGYNQVAESLNGFPSDLVTAHPIPGKWSAAEIVHHLADSETTSALRLRRLLVEDHPLIQGYDQEAFAARLNYNNRDMAPALEAFRSGRATTAQLFDLMSEDDWRHAHNHADQIRRLRDAVAK